MYDELYHFGVKGMRWGVRKDRGSAGMRQKKQIKRRMSDINKAQKKRYAETDITSMSDNELRSLNNRIQMENTYKDGMQSRLSIGKKITEALVNSSGSVTQKTVSAIALSTASVVGVRIIRKLLSEKHPVAATELADLFEKGMKPKSK